MELLVNGEKHILIKNNEPCALCGGRIYCSWNLFHGEATSHCCGAVYQIKDYHIGNPTEEQQILLDMLKGEYIELRITEEYINAIKKVFAEEGIQNIQAEGFYEKIKYAAKVEGEQ